MKLALLPTEKAIDSPIIRGERHAAFVDIDWVNGPAGDVDLFREFSKRHGSIGLTEALAKLPDGRPIALYYVPESKVPAFVAFVNETAVAMPDGSRVAPVCTRGRLSPQDVPDRRVHQFLNRVYVIRAAVASADRSTATEAATA